MLSVAQALQDVQRSISIYLLKHLKCLALKYFKIIQSRRAVGPCRRALQDTCTYTRRQINNDKPGSHDFRRFLRQF